MSVLLVGSIAIDNIITQHHRADNILGGSASFCGVAVGLFERALLVGVVGEDFPGEYIELFRKNNIDLQGLEVVKGGKTFTWTGKYKENFNERETLDIQLNTFADFHPRIPEVYMQSKFLMLGNIQPGLQLEVLKQVRNPDFIMADTMDLWINTDRKELDKLISQINCLVLNDSEASLYTGHNNIIRAARSIQKAGPEIVIIKKGSHGAMLFNGNSIFSAPAYPLEDVKDPTGAGDSFAGASMGYLASQGRVTDELLRKAVVYGTVIASYTVSEFSLKGIDCLPREAINQRYSGIKAMTLFQ
ncbi:MAG: PfkB family carbohydrate kinase [bacterium]